MVWSFLSQVLRDGKEAACQAAVARVVSYCQLNGLNALTADTGKSALLRSILKSFTAGDIAVTDRL